MKIFKKKKVISPKESEGNKIVKVMNIIMGSILIIFISLFLIKGGYFYFDDKKRDVTIESISNDIVVLNKMNNELDQLNAKDKEIIESDLLFNKKSFRKDIMDINVLGLTLLEKSGKKNADYSLVRLNLDVMTNKDKDFKKFLLLISLNENIYKIEKISKDNGDKITIVLIYKLKNK